MNRKSRGIFCLSILFLLTLTSCGQPLYEKKVSEQENSGQSMEQVEEERIKKESEENEEQDLREVMQESEFYYEPLSEEIKARITGISYPDAEGAAEITYEELAYVHVLHYDFNHETAEGELICNRSIAKDLVEIFRELYDNEYPIEKIRLVDEYGGDDESSMADNNTSCFNYRVISGTTRLSNHSYGLAIDINPLYNPYVTYRSDGNTNVQPENSRNYVDREAEFAYKISHDDLCYQLFMEHGFTWGGDWNSSKDYQHFEKK